MGEVRFDDVTKVFDGGAVAVDALDLTIGDGELLVLVGPSGCGKTTALRMVAGLETPTSGTIWIGDRVVNDVSPANRDIAMVFQNYALYPHMNVERNIGFPLERRKVPKDERRRRVAEVAEMLDLTPLLRRKPAQLSGGQRQRVAMGRALSREPAAFLLDEPLSNLDAKLRMELRAELKQLHGRVGTTMIYVTHDQVEAMTLGDRIAVMDHGQLQQLGRPTDIYERPGQPVRRDLHRQPADEHPHARRRRPGRRPRRRQGRPAAGGAVAGGRRRAATRSRSASTSSSRWATRRSSTAAWRAARR